MNQGDVFSTPEEAVRQLAAELRELRELLREVSAKLSRIETRAKRTFPSAFPPAQKRALSEGSPPGVETPSISPDEALRIYDEVVVMARNAKREEAERRLASMAVADLVLVVKEIGLSIGKSKPSSKLLIAKILGRAKESVMLSQHTTRGESTDAPPDPPLTTRSTDR